MARIIDCDYLISLVNECYSEQESNCYFYMEEGCRSRKKSLIVEKETIWF